MYTFKLRRMYLDRCQNPCLQKCSQICMNLRRSTKKYFWTEMVKHLKLSLTTWEIKEKCSLNSMTKTKRTISLRNYTTGVLTLTTKLGKNNIWRNSISQFTSISKITSPLIHRKSSHLNLNLHRDHLILSSRRDHCIWPRISKIQDMTNLHIWTIKILVSLVATMMTNQELLWRL